MGLTPRPDERLDDATRGRLLDMMADFTSIMPIYTPRARAFTRATFDMELGAIMPSLMQDVYHVIQKDPAVLVYLNWMKEAIRYVLGERPDKPPIDEAPDQEWRDRHG